MKAKVLFICLIICHITSAQNLIEKTKLGLNYHSSKSPNRLWKNQKSNTIENKLSIFELAKNKTSIANEINLALSKEKLEILKKKARENFLLDIPVDRNHNITISFSSHNPISNNYNLTNEKGEGIKRSNIVCYKGVINNDHGSIASLTLINDDIHISISDKDGHYRVGKNIEDGNYKLYLDETVSDAQINCGSMEQHKIGSAINHKYNDQTKDQSTTNQKAAGDVVEVYVECDYELYLDKNGVAGVEAYVAQLFNEIAVLYKNESISIAVSDIKVWTTPDPYRNINNTGTILDSFGGDIQNNYKGRLAAFLGGNRTNSCSVSGIAWVDVLCDGFFSGQNSGPYSATIGLGYCSLGSYPNFSIDVSIVAHELGHNFGSPHTHNCSWGPNNNRAIDNCPGFTEGNCSLVSSPTPNAELGTIMSYCNNVNFTKGFGTEPGNLIRNRYNSANCLAPGGDPCTHVNRTYNNATISTTTVRADNNITLINNVNIISGSLINWSFENELIINGTLTVPLNSRLEVVAGDCQ